MESERPTPDGLIEFRESRFSVNAAKQSLFIPPDWDKYSNASIVHREGKILGSFDRKISSVREDILFYAPGDALYDSIISNAVGCSRGRCSAIQLHSTFDFDGLVFIYDVQPAVDALMDAHINLELLSRYRMYLPLNQIYIVIPLTKESQAVEDKTIISLLTQANQYQADHLGKRSAKRGMVAPIERFIMKTPPEKWEPLIANAAKIAYKKATKALKDNSELRVARQEMLRVIDGLRAECVFFERSEKPADELEAKLELVFQALKDSRPELDATCFLRVRKNG